MNKIEFYSDLITQIVCNCLEVYNSKDKNDGEKWITIKPHGKEADDYRRLKLEDGETVEEAMHRQGYYSKRQTKDEKQKHNSNAEVAQMLGKINKIRSEYEQKLKYYQKNKMSTQEKYKLATEINYLVHNFQKQLEEEKSYIKSNSSAYSQSAAIAGVQKGASMDFKKADSNNVNPKYSRDSYEYSHNCQSSVVAYEARRRGYNVEAVARNKFDKTDQLARHASWAYVEKTTGKPCEPKEIYSTNSINLYGKLEKYIKPNGRYQFSYKWYRGKTIHGHVLCIERNGQNEIQIYDPQTSKIISGKTNVTLFLKQQVRYKKATKLLRVDDKDFNEYFINDVVKRK